jgi:hypothetical protein
MIAREYNGQGRPHVARIGEAVKHDNSGSVATDPDMDRRAVGLNVLRLEIRRERLNPSCSRQGKPKTGARKMRNISPTGVWGPMRPQFNFTAARALLLESFEQSWAPCHYTVDLRYDSSPLSNR